MKTPQQKTNQRLILLIFALSFVPFFIAFYLKENPEFLANRTNHGTLITPPVTTEITDFIGFDQFSRDNMTQLKGHWVLVNVIPGNECAAACLDAIHKSKQLLLMMSKDLTRMRRLVVMLSPVDTVTAPQWWQDDTRLLRALPNDDLKQKINAIANSGSVEGQLLIMDPLGNLMMFYTPGFDAYKVKDDLKKLLTVSQIG